MNKMLLQKLFALYFIVFGILTVPLCDMDVTGAVLFVPIGIYLLVTKKCWIY